MDDYWTLVGNVVRANEDEIEADLAAARAELDRLRADERVAAARVTALEALLDVAPSPVATRPTGGTLTLHAAMAEVLATAPERMMRANDLAAEIRRRRLYVMRDGRPAEPQQVHARVGNYGDMFERVGTFIKLR